MREYGCSKSFRSTMASNIFLGYILALLALVHCAPESVKDLSLGKSNKCKDETGATLEDFVEYERWETLHANSASKCMVYCSIHAWGAIKSDESIDESKAIQYFAQALKKEDQAKGIKLFEGCVASTKKNPDHCEFAYQFVQCFFDHIHKEKLQRIQFVKKDGSQE